MSVPPDQLTAPASGSLPTEDHLTDFIQRYQGELDQDTQGLHDLSTEYKTEPFDQKPPERNNGIMSVAPYLIGLAALGGKMTGLHASAMLGATNGMVKGLIQGNEQAYADHKKAYDDAYQKWLDKWTQQQKLYNEMRQVYKGRIDADLRALQFARQAMGDQARVTQADVKNTQNAEKIADGFKKTNETIRHDRAIEQIRQESAKKTIDEESINSNAQAIANYQLPPPSSRSAQSYKVMAKVMELNPAYDATQYRAKGAAVQAFDTGKQGNSVRSFNVAISHLDTLQEATLALKNNDTKMLNRIGNAISSETGHPAPTNFNAVKSIVAEEIVKAVTGAAGALGDRETAQATLDRANSPEQLLAVIEEYHKLMAGQLSGLKQQYEQSTRLQDFDRYLSPRSKEVMGNTTEHKTLNGKNYVKMNGQWFEETADAAPAGH